MNTIALIAAETVDKTRLGPLGVLGLVAQGVFAGRFFYQWVASERRHHSYVPVGFWWLSVSGGAMMLVYALGLTFMTDAGVNALALVLGQAGGLVVYVRNLALIYRKRGLTDGEVLGAGDALYVHSADEHTGQGSAPAPAPTESPDDAPVSE